MCYAGSFRKATEEARQGGSQSPGGSGSSAQDVEVLPTPTPPATCFLQIVGSRLRIPQVTPADSGEYVCHVSNGAGSRETSLIVTIQGSGSSHGESREGRGSRQVV